MSTSSREAPSANMTQTGQTAPTRWWETAPDPDCLPWCERQHTPGEFQKDGGWSCTKDLGTIAGVEVSVVGGTFAGDTPESYGPEAFVGLLNRGNDEITAGAAHALALLLLEAARVVRVTEVRS